MTSGPTDKLLEVQVGDTLSAEQYNLMRKLAQRQVVGPNVFQTSYGVYIRPDSASSGSSVEFCTVFRPATSDDSEAKTVWVKLVVLNTGTGVYEVDPSDAVNVQCYPGHVQRDFFPISSNQTGGPIEIDTIVCRLFQVRNVWHVEPFSKQDRREHNSLDRQRFSDCQLQGG